MSGKSIQRTLNNAFAVVGRVLGWPFKVYRPLDWVNPTDDRNYVANVMLAATPDEAFSKDPLDELDKYLLYVNTTKLEPGDIIVSDELAKTYVIFDKTELRAVIGVLAADKFNLLRPTVTTGADVMRGFTQVGANIPCALKISGATSSDGALKITSSTMSAASSQVEIWSWVPANFARLNDVIEIGDVRYLVTFAQTTAKGTKLKATSTKVGK